jgi:hypothetical protein
MQHLLWYAAFFLIGVCLALLGRILVSARRELKSRRRAGQILRWMREQGMAAGDPQPGR